MTTPLETSILCRAALALPSTATGEMMFMPGGMQTITPFEGGVGKPIAVLVDAAGAQQLEVQRSQLAAKGKRPFFDFNHEDRAASFWPTEFFWRAARRWGQVIYGRIPPRGPKGLWRLARGQEAKP